MLSSFSLVRPAPRGGFPLWPIVLSVALLGSAGAQAGSVYKWVDESGVVQFSDVPPIQSEFERVNLKVGIQLASAKSEDDRLQDIYQLLEDYEDEREGKRRTDEQVAMAAKDAQRRCAYARDELSRMNGVRRVATASDDGELTFVGHDTREATARRLQAEIESYCGGAGQST